MFQRYSALWCVPVACVILSQSGCNFGTSEESSNTTAVADGDSAGLQAIEGAAQLTEAANSVSQRFGELFAKVLPTLEEARELVDRHADLPDDSAIPFREDKVSNAAAMNELLDEAIVMLGISEVSDFRQRIRDANTAISDARSKIADLQRERVSAPWEEDQGRIDKVNPFSMTKEAIDESIKNEKSEIKTQQELLVTLKETFAKELSKIGVEVDKDGVEALLASVSGDDIVTMAVVFDNIKKVTTQLQALTEESGEALDVSKKYYGMYVVMVHVMDRIQKTFIRDVNDKHIPKLKEYGEQADENIRQARALIKVNGGDAETLKANIESNQLTQRTANLYIEYLEHNAELIAEENKRSQKNLATAMNTYDTVKLSSDVAALMSTGRRDFETLMKLQVPSLREFGNEAIRKEFQKMTTELRGE